MYGWLAGGILIGITLVIVALTLGKNVWRYFADKTRLIKHYWIFVSVFVFLAVLAYICVLRFYRNHDEDVALSVLNQSTILIFSIFVGYFAFAQVTEARTEKLQEKGDAALADKQYDDAIKYYEQADASSPKEYSVLANLSEAYLIQQEFDNLHRKLRTLNLVSSGSKKITCLYLQAGMSLMKGYLNDARADIKRTVDYVEAHQEDAVLYRWNFGDIRQSRNFQALRGDQAKMFTNLIRYLGRELSPEEKARFVSGDYSLDPAPTALPH